MAQAGDNYTVPLKEAHLNWGEHRNPTNREPVPGEGYIPIPRDRAEAFGIYNSNYAQTGPGYNEFRASSSDGCLQNVCLLAQGCSGAGDIYAKQFSVRGDLKAVGRWYANVQASAGNSVRVEFTSSTHIQLTIV